MKILSSRTVFSWSLLVAVGSIGAYLAWQMYLIPRDQVADADNPNLVALGKAVYAENCASCHGANLEGQPNWRSQLPEGGLPAPPHDETGHTWHHPDMLNFRYTKYGGQKIAPSGFKSNMPGFEETLSDNQIWAVLAFIKSKWPENIRKRHARRNAVQ